MLKLQTEKPLIGIAASNGKMVKFKEDDVRSMGRTASGVRGINLAEGEYVVGVTTSLEGGINSCLNFSRLWQNERLGRLSPHKTWEQRCSND